MIAPKPVAPGLSASPATSSPSTTMPLSQWGLLILLSVLWGGTFLFVGLALRELPPFTIVLARVATAAAILIPVVYMLGHRMPSTWRQWQPFVVMSMLNNVIPFSLMVTGQQTVASGLVAVLNAATPMFTLLVAYLLAGEKLAANKLGGVALGMAGVAILVGPEALLGRAAQEIGMLMIVVAALSYGFSGLWGRRLKSSPPIVTAASQLTSSTVALLPLALVIEKPWLLPFPGLETVAAVVALASLSTALAYIIFFRIMAVSGPSNVMLVTLLIPLTAIPLGIWKLGDVLLMRHFAGAAVIGLSLLVIDGRAYRWLCGRAER
jgi:drug/metabolite transporter (DMT)-like permease